MLLPGNELVQRVTQSLTGLHQEQMAAREAAALLAGDDPLPVRRAELIVAYALVSEEAPPWVLPEEWADAEQIAARYRKESGGLLAEWARG